MRRTVRPRAASRSCFSAGFTPELSRTAGFKPNPFTRMLEVAQVVLPVVPAGEEEAGEVRLLVEEGEHADADAPRDAEEHRLGERLAGVRVAHARVGQEHAQCGRGRNVAGEMPAHGRVSGLGRSGADHLPARAGVTLACLFHARPDEALEMFLLGHC